jgi:uncharacterized protein (TIGR03083 family)
MGEPTGAQGIAALEEIWASIAALTASLSDEDWASATDCPGWDVKDHLSHMIGTERSMAGERTPEIDEGTPAHVRNAIGESNERWVVSRRPRSGPEVRDEFIEVTHARLEALRSLNADDFETIGWSPVGQVPLRVFLEVRAMDCWVHEQDIRLALGRPGGRGGAGEAASLSRVELALGQVLGKGVRPADASSITVTITGPISSTRRLEMVDGRAQRVEGAASTTTLTVESLTYLLRFAGRISTADVLEEKGTVLSGDAALGEAFLDALALMI